jgi:starch synthase
LTRKKLKILMVSSECFPFAKTGGLADVVGSLPPALKKHGHDVRVVIPKYSFIDPNRYKMRPVLNTMCVWMGDGEEWCSVYETLLNDEVIVYLIEFQLYFARSGLYHDEYFNDYLDNPRRFAFFSRAALQLCKDINFKPDIVHANDWQTALIPAYLKVWHWNDPVLGRSASVLTIHNMVYQGIYPKSHYRYIGLGENNFTSECLECFGKINFLKGGIYFADMVNTVSPTYCRETKTPEGGYGLAPYLNNIGSKYTGILNGIDYEIWNPEIDKLIPANYGIDNLQGKSLCKKVLQKSMLLEENPDIPIIGIISRFVPQKGLHLLAQCIDNILNNMIVQFAILGSGEKDLEYFFYNLPSRYPGKAGSFIGYSNELSHLIEAGSDFFLMPSLYEPCGLNQIYSLKYGTLPIVRAIGGLEDTVENYDEKTGEGTGFKFYESSANAIYYTVGWAVSTYYDRKNHLQKLIKNAMSKHFSWEDSAKKYIELYKNAIVNKKALK